jgi:nitrogen fixation/metabolism regulation signal transduction histidine kinase
MATMPNLPTTRQRTHSKAILRDPQNDAKDSLTRAFVTFTQAAGSLERSYTQLQGEVTRLHRELDRANSELERSLEENARVRGYLSRVLDNLPCGVLVVDGAGRVQIANPEARHLLQTPGDWAAGMDAGLPEPIQRLLRDVPPNSFFSEREWSMSTSTGNRTIGILRANISEIPDTPSDSIWIVRDITDQKRLAEEREAARRSLALAEVATVLAHEIRNPLGSMELFTGLLADATSHLPETRQWVMHLQAGLRALSATTINMVQ